jgi:membrane fusion protein (multidrug efflux system)
MADRIITAPFDGLLGFRNISVGTLLQPGMMITTLDDDSVMKLDFEVPSVFLSAVKQGLPIKVSSKAFEGKYFDGVVSSIDSQINPVTRSFKVRAIIPNTDLSLKPGLLMIVELFKNERVAVMVPEEAILMEADKAYVYTAEVADGKTVATKKRVSIGARQPGRIEITEGIVAGEKVISHGIIKISDGAEITIRAQRKSGDDVKDILKKGSETPEAESQS